MRRLPLFGVIITLISAVVVLSGQTYTPLTALMNLPGRTDSSGNVAAYGVAAAGPYTPLTALANLRGRTDSNGNLAVALVGGTSTPDVICLDATNQDSCLVRSAANTIKVSTSSTGLTAANITAAAVTGTTGSFGGGAVAISSTGISAGGVNGTFSSINFATISGGGSLIVSTAPPTISSGFGSSPSVSGGSTAAFTVNVGTGGSATNGVLALPTVTTGWRVSCDDLTTKSATVFVTKETATSTTTATIGNFNTSGAAAAWVSGDTLVCSAMAY